MRSTEEIRRASVHRPPSRLPHFQLADQFGRERDELTYDGIPVIVVAGNREGAKGAALWTAALRDVIRSASDTKVLSVADLGGVPRMLRRSVSRMLPRDPAHWCALDWDGQIGARIRRDHGPVVEAAYGTDGMLRVWAALPLDMVDRAILAKLVQGAADSPSG